jgi:hypothetical protein
VEAIEETGAPIVIFITAYDSFALRAFETPAVDYLLKPVEFDRLSAALNRARERRAALDAGRRAQELAAVLEALRSESHTREGQSYEREFWIRERGRFFRVPITDIERIEAERDYVRLHWEGRTLLYRETMTNLEERLDPKRGSAGEPRLCRTGSLGAEGPADLRSKTGVQRRKGDGRRSPKTDVTPHQQSLGRALINSVRKRRNLLRSRGMLRSAGTGYSNT